MDRKPTKQRGTHVRLSRQIVRLSVEIDVERLPKKNGHVGFRALACEIVKIVPRVERLGPK